METRGPLKIEEGTMMRDTGVLFTFTLLATFVPRIAAGATVNIPSTAGDDVVCVVKNDDDGKQYYCVNGDDPVEISTGDSVQFKGQNGNDIAVVNGAVCECSCQFPDPVPFVYGTNVTVNFEGEGGADHLVGGNGPNSLLGGPGDDLLHGGPATDTISGNDNDDVLHDGGGAGDSLDAGNHLDCVNDPSGYASCSCGGGTNDAATPGTPGAPCNADCESSPGNCTTYECPDV